MVSPSTLTASGSVPRIVSYLSRCAIVLMSPRSLAATISKPVFPLAFAARQTLRPMRPKPLIPTRIVTALISLAGQSLADYRTPLRGSPGAGAELYARGACLGPHHYPAGTAEFRQGRGQACASA